MQQANAGYVDSTDSCSEAASELERVKLGVGWNLSVTWLVNVACVFAFVRKRCSSLVGELVTLIKKR